MNPMFYWNSSIFSNIIPNKVHFNMNTENFDNVDVKYDFTS